ncbi:MAG: ABC transporter ATP-binding protein [Actinobacteria bacterium]|nr:ABC transporter ATP-binding protein [Actinomycetota bacterium]
MEKKVIVSLKNVYFNRNGISVLEDINLSIESNDLMAIMGPNGGGKTTLLELILGLEKPLKGEVLVFGKTPGKSRNIIGYLQQNPTIDLDFPACIFDVVLMGRYRKLAGGFGKDDISAAGEALKKVGMFELKDRHISQLSGGQLQRVLIARAIARDPKLLLLDEPLNSIDPEMQEYIYKLLLELRKEMAVVYVTHDIGAIPAYVEKIACVNRKLFYHGPKEGSLGKLAEAYKCPVEIVAHGIPHRILGRHKK